MEIRILTRITFLETKRTTITLIYVLIITLNSRFVSWHSFSAGLKPMIVHSVCLTHRRKNCYQCTYERCNFNCETILLDDYNVLMVRQKQILDTKIARATDEAYDQIELKKQRIMDRIEADPRKSYVNDMSNSGSLKQRCSLINLFKN